MCITGVLSPYYPAAVDRRVQATLVGCISFGIFSYFSDIHICVPVTWATDSGVPPLLGGFAPWELQ
eukprot:9122799-Heterocapsa_arctica.AAC.1